MTATPILDELNAKYPGPLIQRARDMLGERRGYDDRYITWVKEQCEWLSRHPFELWVEYGRDSHGGVAEFCENRLPTFDGAVATGDRLLRTKRSAMSYRIVDIRTVVTVHYGHAS